MMLALIPVFVFITFALVAYALMPAGPDVLAQRLRPYEYLDRGERSELEKPFSERVLWPIVATIAKSVMRASPQQVHDQVTAELEKAGNPVRPATFLFLRFALLIGLPAIYGLPLYLSHRPPSLLQVAIVFLLFFFGYRLPLTWLRLKIDAKKTAIEKALPDALDLITVCMEAGLAFDASLSKVVQKTKGPLSDEFGRVLQEIGLGKLRREALRDLGQRSGVPDLKSFVAAIVQADQMGLSIADILRTQADELRVRRRQRAEEKAMKAPVKMLFPLIVCIFPAMMVVMLGPAVWAIYTNVISRMHGV
ncbi:MAG: type II secretion system F family protein [Chloroflexi bacterium]|nr:type II secretion system F family protein [Chloroflexota bacterium]